MARSRRNLPRACAACGESFRPIDTESQRHRKHHEQWLERERHYRERRRPEMNERARERERRKRARLRAARKTGIIGKIIAWLRRAAANIFSDNRAVHEAVLAEKGRPVTSRPPQF
jgi:hypothetical protein